MRIVLDLDAETISRINRAIDCHSNSVHETGLKTSLQEYIEMLIEGDLEFIEAEFVKNIHTGQISERSKVHQLYIDQISGERGLIEGQFPSSESQISIRKDAFVRMTNEGWNLLADVAP